MLNRVVLIGRLTRDVELRYTQSGDAVGSFTIAVNRNFTNQNGEREADFINAVIWRKAAENFSNFTSKGSLVGIEGQLRTRSYENQQGQRVYVTEVNVDNFALLESRAESESRRAQASSNGADNSFGAPTAATQNPFDNAPVNQMENTMDVANQNNTIPDPFAATSSDEEIDLSDDDLPF